MKITIPDYVVNGLKDRLDYISGEMFLSEITVSDKTMIHRMLLEAWCEGYVYATHGMSEKQLDGQGTADRAVQKVNGCACSDSVVCMMHHEAALIVVSRCKE